MVSYGTYTPVFRCRVWMYNVMCGGFESIIIIDIIIIIITVTVRYLLTGCLVIYCMYRQYNIFLQMTGSSKRADAVRARIVDR
jgi:hypothetical protein